MTESLVISLKKKPNNITLFCLLGCCSRMRARGYKRLILSGIDMLSFPVISCGHQ